MYDKKQLGELKKSLDQWEETSLSKALDSLPERRDDFITTSSEPINRLYTPLDVRFPAVCVAAVVVMAWTPAGATSRRAGRRTGIGLARIR